MCQECALLTAGRGERRRARETRRVLRRLTASKCRTRSLALDLLPQHAQYDTQLEVGVFSHIYGHDNNIIQVHLMF